MEAVDGLLSEGDILFLLETVMPEREGKEQAVALVRSDAAFTEALLGHEQVFQRLVGEEEIVLKVSPYLFFSVLLRRARQDLEMEAYTVERRQRQRVAIFDAEQAAGLLARRSVRSYLAGMLASFVRLQSFTRRVRVRKGVWHRQRYNDLDVDSLRAYCSGLEEEDRFQAYRRIADVCLFLAGVFPEYVESQGRSPYGPAPRWATRRTIEDYEREGCTYYSLAANHRQARADSLDGPLTALAKGFTLAEKPLWMVADRYLKRRKHSIFEL